MKAARKLAADTLAMEKLTDEQRIDHIYETVTSKLPDVSERATYLKLLEDLQSTYSKDGKLAEQLCEGLELPNAEAKARVAAWSVFVNTVYNLDITKTRE